MIVCSVLFPKHEGSEMRSSHGKSSPRRLHKVSHWMKTQTKWEMWGRREVQKLVVGFWKSEGRIKILPAWQRLLRQNFSIVALPGHYFAACLCTSQIDCSMFCTLWTFICRAINLLFLEAWISLRLKNISWLWSCFFVVFFLNRK